LPDYHNATPAGVDRIVTLYLYKQNIVTELVLFELWWHGAGGELSRWAGERSMGPLAPHSGYLEA
jgi:hypothetical protein